jgi:hypothetical protein
MRIADRAFLVWKDKSNPALIHSRWRSLNISSLDHHLHRTGNISPSLSQQVDARCRYHSRPYSTERHHLYLCGSRLMPCDLTQKPGFVTRAVCSKSSDISLSASLQAGFPGDALFNFITFYTLLTAACNRNNTRKQVSHGYRCTWYLLSCNWGHPAGRYQRPK